MTDATKPANELCPYFELSSSLGYRTLQWSDTNDRLGLHVIRLFRSLSPIPDWRPPILRPTTYEETINAEEESETAIERFENGFGDSPNYTSCFLLFSQSAVEKCRTILERSGELLPVEVIDVETKYLAFHCLTQIDAIDLSASTVERFKHDGSIRRFLCAPGVTIPRIHRDYSSASISETSIRYLQIVRPLLRSTQRFPASNCGVPTMPWHFVRNRNPNQWRNW